jgi:hypothetical protein
MHSRLWDYTITESATTPANAQVNTTLPNTGQATFATVACFDHPQAPYSQQIAVTWETKADTARMDPPFALSEFMLQKFENPVRFVLKSRLAKISFDAIPAFSPMAQCTIG